MFDIIITVIITIKERGDKMKRYSKQRETILEILRSTKLHPTASVIYERAREVIPNISLGTVYRNLHELSVEGEILAFKAFDGSEHYDATVEPHPHMSCNSCKRIIDLDIPFVSEFVLKSAEHTGAEFNGHHIVFYGKCSDCI